GDRHGSTVPDGVGSCATPCPLSAMRCNQPTGIVSRPARCQTRTMPELRSKTSTHGRTMAGARALWRATGMTDDDFGKPIVAIANSFTQFVPGHVHLKDLGGLVAGAIAEAGGVG